VGSSLVVVLDEDGQDGCEVALVADQQPVQALGSDGADPSLGVGVGPRRLDGGSDDASVLATEDAVEAGHELAVAVTDQELDVFVVVGQGGGQVAGGLGDPAAGRDLAVATMNSSSSVVIRRGRPPAHLGSAISCPSR
jgi:hypothetical protein